MFGGVFLAVCVMIAIAAVIGLINGLAIAVLEMPAFMVTLVSMMTISALAIYLTQSENIAQLPESYVRLGKGDLVSVYFGVKDTSQLARKEVFSFITYPMVIAVAVAVGAHILLNRTVFGRQVLAIGMNRRRRVSGGRCAGSSCCFVVSPRAASAASLFAGWSRGPTWAGPFCRCHAPR